MIISKRQRDRCVAEVAVCRSLLDDLGEIVQQIVNDAQYSAERGYQVWSHDQPI